MRGRHALITENPGFSVIGKKLSRKMCDNPDFITTIETYEASELVIAIVVKVAIHEALPLLSAME